MNGPERYGNPMFNLKITDLPTAKGLLAHGWPTKAVSLVCPGTDLWHHGDHHHIVWANDIPVSMPGMVAPEREHVEGVLAFTADLKPDDKLLVHCFAGISRSTAMAIGILISHGVPYAEAFATVENIRPFMHPNTRIIRFIDELMGLDGKLVSHLVNWQKAKHAQTLTQRKLAAQASFTLDVEKMKRYRDLFK